MKRLRNRIVFAFFCLIVFPIFGFADTNVSGIISSDTTWTLARIPYIVTGNVFTNSAMTLTFEPGVIAKFKASGQDIIYDWPKLHSNERNSGYTDLAILPPTITGFTPKSGTMGSQINLTGTHFNTEISGNIIRINDLIAAVTNASASELKVIVPEGAITGKISLTIGETTTTTTDNFTVTDFENKFVVRGLNVQFDRRGVWAGYYTGQLIKDLNIFESSLGHTVAEEVSLQLDEMKKIGVNTITLELRSSDPGWTGGFEYPACNVHEATGLSYPVPTQSEITNLLTLFDLIHNKQIKIMLMLVNTHMEEQPPLNNTQWISAILNVVKDHPALDLVLFDGNTRLVDSNGDGKKDQCGIPAEPPLWLGPSSIPANYVKWAIQYGMTLGLPANKLSAECVVGWYVIDAESPSGPDATGLHLWRTVKVLKQIFDDLAVPDNQRTYAISFYQQRKCENANGVPCVDANPSVWAEETWKNVFEIIGRKDSRVVAVEMGLNKYDPNWTTERAFETHIKLIKRYGVAGGCFWRWVFADDNEKNDLTLSTPVKKRGLTFEYNAVKDKMAQYYSTISVTSPNCGESWVIGSVHNITWTTTGTVGNVKIEYSKDSGSSYTTIIASTVNSGSYPWTVPDTPSMNCLVKISDASSGTPSDTSDAIFMIVAAAPPTIKLNKTKLNYAAISGGISSSNQTAIISNIGVGTLNWTAASNKSWLEVLPGSGTGTGVIQVNVNAAGQALGTQTGTITVTDPYASNNPQTIEVALTVKVAGSGTVPFGDFATPINGTTGITGAIPVTGWMLDDIETTKVEIWRDAFAGETEGIWKIGDAIFVEGARPDVEQAYPDYPLNYRAGWGYMLLTNMLPNHGNGTCRLHAYAYDKEGNKVLLGTKTITCSNAAAVKPFGAIDTPSQGGDASGNPFVNFGWVLTPMPKTVPKDGSTIEVYVDGAKLGTLATAPNVYNQYRVDVSTNFPGFNNTGGPEAGGPVGAFFLDATKLTNGVHTIHWIARDDAGAADGIGSRFFNIVNTGTSANELSHREERSDAAIRLEESSRVLRGISSARSTLEDILALPLSFEPLRVKTGFDLKAEPATILPDNLGVCHVQMGEVEPLELFLNPAQADQIWNKTAGSGDLKKDNPPPPPFRKGGEDTSRKEGEETKCVGYLRVGVELRPLPIGSTLDSETGLFSWLPGPGFLGTYNLLFLQTDGLGITRRIPVKVTIRPKFYN